MLWHVAPCHQHLSCHYWKYFTIPTSVFKTLHALCTPQPTGNKFIMVWYPSHTKITLSTLTFDVSSRPAIFMVIWHIHGALSWLCDNTDTLHLTVPYLLTPWSRIILENLTDSQLVKKFPTFYGSQRFIIMFTMFTRVSYLPLFWPRSIQSINTWLLHGEIHSHMVLFNVKHSYLILF